MRVIDFMQLIDDLDKQIQIFYQAPDGTTHALIQLHHGKNQCFLSCKKAGSHSMHQWELMTLLNTVQNKNLPLTVALDNHLKAVYGVQIKGHTVLLK